MNWNRGDVVGFGKLHQKSANPSQESSRVDLKSGNHQLDLSRREPVFEKEELPMTVVDIFSEKTIEDFSKPN